MKSAISGESETEGFACNSSTVESLCPRPPPLSLSTFTAPTRSLRWTATTTRSTTTKSLRMIVGATGCRPSQRCLLGRRDHRWISSCFSEPAFPFCRCLVCATSVLSLPIPYNSILIITFCLQFIPTAGRIGRHLRLLA